MEFRVELPLRTEKEQTSQSSTHPIFSILSLSYRQAMQRSPTLISASHQSLHKSQFLQKISCQKPWWDHARLSGLVNKQVGITLMTMAIIICYAYCYLKGEPDAAELWANTDATHTCSKFLKYFLADIFLFDAN